MQALQKYIDRIRQQEVPTPYTMIVKQASSFGLAVKSHLAFRKPWFKANAVKVKFV
jgi:hypothetical protein